MSHLLWPKIDLLKKTTTTAKQNKQTKKPKKSDDNKLGEKQQFLSALLKT